MVETKTIDLRYGDDDGLFVAPNEKTVIVCLSMPLAV